MKILWRRLLLALDCDGSRTRLAMSFWIGSSEALTFSAFDEQLRVRLSGTIDLEGYHSPRPTPALIDADGHFVFQSATHPLFRCAACGRTCYFFAQARVDRGFDPSDGGAEVRLDEYAVRITPWDDGRFNLQIGRFATVVGNWMERHLSWDNPFVNAPLAYENLTGIWDSAGADSMDTLLGWAHVRVARREFRRRRRRGQTSAQSRSSGARAMPAVVSVSRTDREDRICRGIEERLALFPARIVGSSVTIGFEHPTFSGRLGFRPNHAWNLGVSASTGSYLRAEAEPPLAAGHSLGDYRQIVFGQDISFAWRHWQSGRSFMKRVLRFRASAMWTHFPIMPRRNTNSPRSSLARSAGTSSSFPGRRR